MIRIGLLFTTVLAGSAFIASADDTVVFRSDVALIRVDAQVVDRDNRTITGLRAEDFVLRDEGKVQEVRNFAREEMPVDFLFLLDVSSSMRPHVQRIAEAAHDALRVLSDEDRFAIMVFDRSTRVRMPFRKGRSSLEREFDAVLRQESFHGGTDITRGMYDAAAYIAREGRRDARRAIVILTDDETELGRDDEGVIGSLERGDTVMSALIAPDAMRTRMGYPGGGGGGGGGGTWPGSGPTIGGPLGGIILGRRGGYGGRGPMGGGGAGYPHTRSAGTSEIAQRSGGDSMPVNDASALETTLSRIRQRYALHFYAPAGVRAGQQRNLSVTLTSAARQRYPDAEVRFRRVYMVPDGVAPAPATVVVAGAEEPVLVRSSSSEPAPPATPASSRRRRAVNEDGSSVASPAAGVESDSPAPGVLKPEQGSQPQSHVWRRVDGSSGSTAGPITSKDAKDPQQDAKDAPKVEKDPAASDGGWRRVKPDDK